MDETNPRTQFIDRGYRNKQGNNGLKKIVLTDDDNDKKNKKLR